MKKFNKTSSSHQDIFAYEVCGDNGIYLEVGGSDGYINNNTYALETEHGWTGISIEINKNRHQESWSNRSNNILWENALELDYEDALSKNGFPLSIDYLQVDIEPANKTFSVLENILKTNIDFKCCTFEHDRYARKKGDPDFKKLADELMLSNGYKIAVENVLSRKNKKYYETWYVKNKINWDQLNWEDWKNGIESWAGFI